MRAIITRYTELRSEVLARVRKVNQMTEEGSLKAGRELQKVVEIARSHIAQLRDLLVGATDSGLQRAIAQHAEHVRRHGASLDLAVMAHAAEVALVAESARQIKAAALEVDRANKAARVLSINARIESSRSGSHVFKAIATAMSELAKSIAGANGRVHELASSMETALPQLVAQSASLRRMAADFTSEARTQIDEVDREVMALRESVTSTLALSDHAIETIIASSFDGLSALQFQDVCAQSLLQIDAWEGAALRATAEDLGIEADVASDLEAVSNENAIGSHASAGELVLF